jgi:hypothetical protein
VLTEQAFDSQSLSPDGCFRILAKLPPCTVGYVVVSGFIDIYPHVQTALGILRMLKDSIVSKRETNGHDHARGINTRLALVEELAGSGRATFELTRKGERSLKQGLKNYRSAKAL